jgi:predicted transport protein
MSFFSITSGKFVRIKEKKFDYERDLQKLVESNIKELFGLDFIRGSLNSEFHIKGTHQDLYFDTLAFDPQTMAFVILEYKKDRNISVIDQGYTYLSTLINNKAEFILEYEEQKNLKLKRTDVDWNQTRVIFISREFTPYQKGAIGFKDVPFELWEAQLFENGFCSFMQIKTAETQESISKFTKSPTVKKVTEEVKTFTFEDHNNKASAPTRALLDDLRKKIFDLDEQVKEKPVQNYIGYKINWFNFVTVHVYRDKLKAYVRMEKLENDPKKRFTKVPVSYNWGKTPLWWLDISNSADVNYMMAAIEESYKKAPDR